MKYTIRLIVVILFILPCHRIFSQTLQNDVIASAGNVYILGNKEISWTLGESFTDSYQSGPVMISQGFHQPIFKFFEIPEKENPGFQVNVFPNPATSHIQIEFTDLSENENFRLILNDIMGKILLDQAVNSKNNNQIDLRAYSQGILLFTIIRVKDGKPRIFKIIRIAY